MSGADAVLVANGFGIIDLGFDAEGSSPPELLPPPPNDPSAP